MEVEKRFMKGRYQWFFEQSFSRVDIYEQFINWLQFEFYFLQQEHGTLSTLYFPNGQVKITSDSKNDTPFVSTITIESKCKNAGLKMKKRFSDFLEYFEHYHRLR